jgi:hypothetical protein
VLHALRYRKVRLFVDMNQCIQQEQYIDGCNVLQAND